MKKYYLMAIEKGNDDAIKGRQIQVYRVRGWVFRLLRRFGTLFSSKAAQYYCPQIPL